MPKHSSTTFDQAALDEFEQKDKLFQMMSKSRSYTKHPAYKALFDALALSLSVDEDDMEKEQEEPPVQKKICRDDQDQKGEPYSKSSKSNKPIDAEDDVYNVDMDAGEFVKDHVVHAEAPIQVDDNVLAHDKSKWFKEDVVVRPETPDPEWHKEPNGAPEQPWFNDLVNAQKNPLTFEDVIGSVFDFTNFTNYYLKKNKLMKADLEGPAFNLIKGRHKNYIELDKPIPLQGPPGRLRIPVDFFFNYELEYLIGWMTGRNYSTSLTKPKATSHWRPKRKIFFKARQAVQSSHHEIGIRRVNQKEYVFKEADFPRLHLNDIEDMILLYIQNKLHHLKGDQQVDLVATLRFFIQSTILRKRVEDVQLGVESYQTKLNLTCPQVQVEGLDAKEPYTIFHKPRGVVYLNKDDKKYLMRADELHNFRDATLKKVRDKLHYMLKNFMLGYNDGMSTRAWSEKDQARTYSMLQKIEKTFLKQRILRSLECFVGGRSTETDYRLLTWTV
ncbi:hypothetical protein Tco_0478489 [Tanacetum coccineum]